MCRYIVLLTESGEGTAAGAAGGAWGSCGAAAVRSAKARHGCGRCCRDTRDTTSGTSTVTTPRPSLADFRFTRLMSSHVFYVYLFQIDMELCACNFQSQHGKQLRLVLFDVFKRFAYR
jgi:hypothetical protein